MIEEEEKVSTITMKEGEQETSSRSTSNPATSPSSSHSSASSHNPTSSSPPKPRRNQLLDILSSTVSNPKSFEVAPKSASTNIPQTIENKSKSKLIIDYQTTPKMQPLSGDGESYKYWINRRDVIVKAYLNLLKRAKIIPSLPKDIVNMIISWASINDTWKLYGDTVITHIKMSQSSQCIERITESHEHCYYSFGSDIIKTGNIKEWKIRIDRVEYYTNNYCSMIIGIVETNKINWIKSLLGDFTYGVYKGYGLRVAIKSRFVHQHTKKQIFIENGNLRKGDIVKIKLDLHNKSNPSSKYGALSYSFEDGSGRNINYGLDNDCKWLGLPKNVAFDKIKKDRSYSLVVGMYCRNKLTFLEDVY